MPKFREFRGFTRGKNSADREKVKETSGKEKSLEEMGDKKSDVKSHKDNAFMQTEKSASMKDMFVAE